MNSSETQATVTLALLVLGSLLYLLIYAFAPTQLVVGPWHLGDAAGAECHGLHQGEHVWVEACR